MTTASGQSANAETAIISTQHQQMHCRLYHRPHSYVPYINPMFINPSICSTKLRTYPMLGAVAMNSKSLGGEFKMSFILQQTVLEIEVETLPLPTSPQYVLYILIHTCI